MKTSMTNFDIAAILPELRQQTIGGHIHNVYQISEGAFLFRIQPHSLNLIVEPSKRIHLTKFGVKTPQKPSQLCMAFRKHTRSAKIVGIDQPNFERIVFIDLEAHGERRRLVVELLPRGNIILLDDHDRVVVSSHYARMKDRSILRNEPLKLPPQRGGNLLEATLSEVKHLRDLANLDVVRAFAQIFGVAGLFAEEILQRANVNKSMPAGELTDEDLQRIFQAALELRGTLLSNTRSPAIVLDHDQIIDVVPFHLERYEDLKKKAFASFNDAVDEYFTSLSLSQQVDQRGRIHIEKRQQLESRLNSQKSQLEEIASSTKTLRTKGDLIFRHLHTVQTMLEIVSEARHSKQPLEDTTRLLQKENKSGQRIYPYFNRLSARGDKVILLFDGTEIELEARKRPQDQAAEYYEKAKKLESKLSGLKASIAETELLLKRLSEKEIELAKPAEPERRREKEWFEKFRWFDSSEGMLVIGGRDAASNELLLKRYTTPEDIVMHAEVHGAPFFVVKTGGTQPRPETLRETAEACLSYSRLWKEGIRSGDAYWVRPEQVGKGAPSGEYLTKGAFMIRGTRNYLRGVELALAIGLTLYDGEPLLMGGPLSAVKSRCQIYTEIRQGRGAPAETARRILATLSKKATEPMRLQLARITIDDVIRLLPSGGIETVYSISP